MPATFVSETAPRLTVTIRRQIRRFENNVLVLEDDEDVKELREAIKKRPELAQLIREVDRAKAEQVARDHATRMAATPVAQSGGLDSGVFHKMRRYVDDARNVELSAAMADPKVREETQKAMEQAGITVTEPTNMAESTFDYLAPPTDQGRTMKELAMQAQQEKQDQEKKQEQEQEQRRQQQQEEQERQRREQEQEQQQPQRKR